MNLKDKITGRPVKSEEMIDAVRLAAEIVNEALPGAGAVSEFRGLAFDRVLCELLTYESE